MALAIVCSVFAVMALANAVAGLAVGEPLQVLWLVAWLPFWYWIGVGAWRRSDQSVSSSYR